MKMTRRNFLSTSAVAAFACGASLTAHAAGSTDENSLNFITDIFKDSTQPGEIEEATAITAEKNAEWYEKLDFSDRREFANAERGWLDNAEGKIIYAEDGKFAWNLQSYGDLNRDAPDTVNPSLWRNTQLNAKAGLFEVCDGIYQVRGFDMANATFIRTNNGWIIFDVLMCKENMQAAKALMENRFGPLDVKAVLYSHSHVDHFGGAEGAIDRNNVADPSLSVDKQLASGKTVILAPKGFLKHAISENVYAGIAMARRAQYQYGTVLEKGEKGALSIGIGMGQSTGHVSLIAPTYEIGEDVPKLTIDGLEIEFQLTPGTEAPAEMNAYFPKYRALWMAENCTGTLHNLYTLRGAEVRDANDWAKYIIEADQRFCSKTDVVFQSHNWPHWGEEIHEYLLNTAAIYKFIHDQTLHYMNQGYTSNEIAAMISLPDALEKSGIPASITARCRITPKPSTRSIWAGTMRTRSTWTRSRPAMPLRSLSNIWAARSWCSARQKRTMQRANISGWHRSPRSWSLQTRPTRRHATCVPMRWSSWVIRRNPVRGATPT